uniref:Peridinin-chl a protein n=1 Tax=Heterocapsa pygmaea TaxID=35672 RepID=UPI0031F5DB37
DKIDDAAKKLSAASYPFLKEIDWSSDVYAKLPTAGPFDVLKAIDKMIVMGAAMDGAALKAGAEAHHKALGSIDAKGVTSLADYTAINAAIGHMVASAGESKTMDVYNAFDSFSLGKDVGPYMMSKVSANDASKAYKAFLEFKDAVKASQ